MMPCYPEQLSYQAILRCSLRGPNLTATVPETVPATVQSEREEAEQRAQSNKPPLLLFWRRSHHRCRSTRNLKFDATMGEAGR